MSDGFVKLECGNNWGVIYYTLPGERLNEYGTCRTDADLVLANARVEVEWPDGSRSEHTLSSRSSSCAINDMGHSYSVAQTLYGVTTVERGVEHWTPIESVRVRFIDGARKKRPGSAPFVREREPRLINRAPK